MKIKVIRAYSGDEGVGPDKDVHEGTEHTVTRARGSQLKANGLVEILADDDADSGEQQEIDTVTNDQANGGQKTAQTPENKAAPKPANKAAPKPAAKIA